VGTFTDVKAFAPVRKLQKVTFYVSGYR